MGIEMIKAIVLGVMVLLVIGILAIGWGGYKLGKTMFGKKTNK